MNLSYYYDELYTSSIEKFEKDNYEIDALLNSPSDNRFGISLIIRPPEEIRNVIQKFLNILEEAEPHQYYYPKSDFHITVMSIISCNSSFDLKNISVPEYVRIIRESLTGRGKFHILYKGITASDSGIMIQGFPSNDSLDLIRNSLRANFRKTDLEQSIDKRYTIKTAHSTVVRYTSKLQNKKEFIEKLSQYRNYHFGNFEAEKIELVRNDWYQRKRNTQLLSTFKLS